MPYSINAFAQPIVFGVRMVDILGLRREDSMDCADRHGRMRSAVIFQISMHRGYQNDGPAHFRW